ncbi:MAG: hypothetical protein Nkreftii_002482 [Candidatus Nitrospira kreftii]|uniref:Uncharacterized protein n=1 Tax=Candidatus Nitrospira kreftii TaxID=2652173 RepID=A0A7S8FF51_9BACT|nr:MAG: hypothetical protein Nkreftii_002482 [Candidatus Nitrospira kreftii]
MNPYPQNNMRTIDLSGIAVIETLATTHPPDR